MTARYLRILADEQVIDPDDVDLAPQIVLTSAERTARRTGARFAGCGQGQQPVVLVPAAGMAVKEWPHWRELATALTGRAFVVGEPSVLEAWRDGPARLLPPVSLRLLAAVFAAAGRRGGVVVGPTPDRCASPQRSARAHRRDLRADAGQPLRSRTDQRGPAGSAGLPAPLPDRDHRAGVLVGGAVPDLAAGTGVHGRRRPGPGPRPGGRPRFGVGIEGSGP